MNTTLDEPFVRSRLLLGTGGGTAGVGVWGGGHSRFGVRCKGTLAHQLRKFGAGEMPSSGRKIKHGVEGDCVGVPY